MQFHQVIVLGLTLITLSAFSVYALPLSVCDAVGSQSKGLVYMMRRGATYTQLWQFPGNVNNEETPEGFFTTGMVRAFLPTIFAHKETADPVKTELLALSICGDAVRQLQK